MIEGKVLWQKVWIELKFSNINAVYIDMKRSKAIVYI